MMKLVWQQLDYKLLCNIINTSHISTPYNYFYVLVHNRLASTYYCQFNRRVQLCCSLTLMWSLNWQDYSHLSAHKCRFMLPSYYYQEFIIILWSLLRWYCIQWALLILGYNNILSGIANTIWEDNLSNSSVTTSSKMSFILEKNAHISPLGVIALKSCC